MEIDLRGRNGRLGQWNDQSLAGDGALGKYPLCQSIEYVSDQKFEYKGCFIDSEDRDMRADGANGDEPGAYVTLDGTLDGDPRQLCASFCAGSKYFALQAGFACFCDSANVMSQGVAPEEECNTPCNGHDGSDGSDPITCGGTWRNAIYELSTQDWEAPGYDDTNWEAAADMGMNGVVCMRTLFISLCWRTQARSYFV